MNHCGGSARARSELPSSSSAAAKARSVPVSALDRPQDGFERDCEASSRRRWACLSERLSWRAGSLTLAAQDRSFIGHPFEARIAVLVFDEGRQVLLHPAPQAQPARDGSRPCALFFGFLHCAFIRFLMVNIKMSHNNQIKYFTSK